MSNAAFDKDILVEKVSYIFPWCFKKAGTQLSLSKQLLAPPRKPAKQR
jgi:hypothetical protein